MAAPDPLPAEDKTTWYGAGLSFSCTACGGCCTGPPGYVWYDDDEEQALADHFGLSRFDFRARYAKRKHGRWTLDETLRGRDYDCVFLKRDENGHGKCSVYHLRPMQCRTWPFWASNLRSERDWREAAAHCPGMKVPGEPGGNFVPAEQIRVTAASNPRGL